ncbi:MAG: hypothetical protein FJ368_00875 [Pelagibacterales bacterium]|nr:hypothetical protein [Pelagibacterales bacterium]
MNKKQIPFLVVNCILGIVWQLYGFLLAWGIADSGRNKNMISVLFEEIDIGGFSKILAIFFIIYTIFVCFCLALWFLFLEFRIYRKLLKIIINPIKKSVQIKMLASALIVFIFLNYFFLFF